MRKVITVDQPTLAQRRFQAAELADLIEKSILTQAREPSDRAKKSFAPSGIGYGAGTCPRQWFYAFTGGVIREDDVDSVGIANMSYGSEAHERIQKIFADTGVLVEAERKVINENPPVFGFADLIIDWQGGEAVGEIKTTSQESFVSKKSKNQPAGYHLLQVLIYMKALGLDKGFLLYENKNTQELLILPVLWNEANKKLANDTWDWMEAVYAAWQAGTKPERPVKKNNAKICKSCAFLTHCWSDDEVGAVKLPVLEVP